MGHSWRGAQCLGACLIWLQCLDLCLAWRKRDWELESWPRACSAQPPFDLDVSRSLRISATATARHNFRLSYFAFNWLHDVPTVPRTPNNMDSGMQDIEFALRSSSSPSPACPQPGTWSWYGIDSASMLLCAIFCTQFQVLPSAAAPPPTPPTPTPRSPGGKVLLQHSSPIFIRLFVCWFCCLLTASLTLSWVDLSHFCWPPSEKLCEMEVYFFSANPCLTSSGPIAAPFPSKSTLYRDNKCVYYIFYY